jgi:hypothetical protein
VAAGRASSRPLLLLLLIAVLLGSAAALLLAPNPTSPGFQLFPTVRTPALPSWLGAVLIVVFLGVTFGGMVLRRLEAGAGFGASAWFSALILFGVAVLFVVLFHLLHPGIAPAANNTTVMAGPGCTPGTSPSCPLPPTGGSGGVPGSVTHPPWYEAYLVYILLVVGVVAAVLVLPRLGADWFAARKTGAPATEIETAKRELAEALRRLSEGDGRDGPRARIIRAYATLLEQVAPSLPDLTTATPREIEMAWERALHLRAETASELTRLFEEARYSQRAPLPADAVPRAEAALRRALAELEARPRRVV